MPAVMVAGCTSWAGKSLLTTALCRWYADQGLRVAPFKGQNMSNNARVVAGGEIGVAQWLQAAAARTAPDVRMNPVLVKPEHDGSQVVVLGRADDELSALAWTQRPEHLWQRVSTSLDELLEEYALVVCEGAGSPAEINLRATDLANLRVAEHADAPVLLVADIARGGSFAHLYGTWALLPAEEQRRLAGFVLNRFRGDAALLGDGPGRLTALTGMAYGGLLPVLEHRLPDEDGARDLVGLGPGSGAPVVAVVRYPTASNLDELTLLASVTDLRWARDPGSLADADLVVLPGAKDVHSDLAWLRRTGLDRAIAAAAARGTRVLGICGGLQVLGEQIGPHGAAGPTPGLGLLPVATRYARDKLVGTVTGVLADDLPEPWTALGGREVDGYDIRHGRTSSVDNGPVAGVGAASPALAAERGWAAGNVLGVACHGLLEDAGLVEALVGVRPVDGLEPTLVALGAAVEEHLDTDLLRRLTRGLL